MASGIFPAINSATDSNPLATLDFGSVSTTGRPSFTEAATTASDGIEAEISIFNALGGQDTITVNDLALTDVKQVVLDLAAGLENNASDGLQDQVTVNGTASADNISVTANVLIGLVQVSGLPTVVRITHPEVANDDLIVNGLGGVDSFSVSATAPTLIGITTNQ